MAMELSVEQRKALVKAIVAAFDQNELASLLLLECDVRLHELVGLPLEWGPLVTQVVQKAVMRDFTAELVMAVAAWRPKNVALIEVLRELTSLPGQGATLAISDAVRGGRPAAEALEGLVRGKKSFVDIDQFLADLASIASRVCRMEELGAPGTQPRALGTGFLVGDDLVLTNKHVCDMLPKDPKRIGGRFDYRVLAGSSATRAGMVQLPAASNWWVAWRDYGGSDISAEGNHPLPEQLDYALLRLDEPVGRFPAGQSADGAASGARGHFSLGIEAPILKAGDDIFVLQHPAGAPMKLAVGRVLPGAPPYRLWHDAPTEGGTSGSPCFNSALQLVALHHATDSRDTLRPAYNQAIPIGLIASDLLQRGGIEA